MWVIHDTPADHPTISREERDYIEKSIGVREVAMSYNMSHKNLIEKKADFSIFIWRVRQLLFCEYNIKVIFSICMLFG